jgi:hypothetical protein
MKTSLLTPHRKAAAISVIAIMPQASHSSKLLDQSGPPGRFAFPSGGMK